MEPRPGQTPVKRAQMNSDEPPQLPASFMREISSEPTVLPPKV